MIEKSRAPVQGHSINKDHFPPGTISWNEHIEVWESYAKRYGRDQSPEQIAERGGFGIVEVLVFLGRLPSTWEPYV